MEPRLTLLERCFGSNVRCGGASVARLVFVLLPCLLCASGCKTESRTDVPGAGNAIVTRTRAAQGWEVRDDGRRAGTVLLYSDPVDRGMGYYSVRNPEGQVLGLIDFGGRAWRYHVHEEQPEWVGTGTVLEGVRRILGASALATLEEVGLASLQGDR